MQINAHVEQSAFLEYPTVFLDHNHTILYCNESNELIVHIHRFRKFFSPYWILLINGITVLLLIPILDRIVYPLCCLWMPTMFSRIRVGMFFSFVSICCAIAVEAIRFHVFEHKSSSVLNINEFYIFKAFSVSVSVGIMAPQLCAQAVAECLTTVTSKHSMYISDSKVII